MDVEIHWNDGSLMTLRDVVPSSKIFGDRVFVYTKGYDEYIVSLANTRFIKEIL